jgi:hypothetical protein
MMTNTKQVSFRPVGQFLRHYVEMCAAMCIGEVPLDALFYGLAVLIGYSDPVHQFPALATLVLAFDMSVPMAAWMRYRGMEWGPIAEMSGAMFAEAMVLIGVAWLGLLPTSSLVVWMLVLMMPVMLVPMLFRLGLYTERMGHHAHAA